MLQAFVLGILTLGGFTSLWLIVLLTTILGLITALETPIRQSFFTDIVEEKNIPVAAALNTSLSTLSLVLGPGLGGLLIATIGTGWTFIANGISFMAVIITLAMMRIEKPIEKRSLPVFQMFREGIRYTTKDSKILLCILLGGIAILFRYSFRSILPAMSIEVFHSGPGVFGLLSSSIGFGAWIGSMFVSARVKDADPYC